MNNNNAQFSVLISVYKSDEPAYLSIALKSIYNDQTLKPDQIVLVADGELTKNQYEIIDCFKKSIPQQVLVIVPLDKNSGLAIALNEGLKHCCYNLVARMDADDISLPKRFEKQIAFMCNNPDIDVCGTYIDEVNTTTGEYISTRKVPLLHDEIAMFAKTRSPVSHPSVIFRKDKVIAINGYPHFRKSQDFALWSKMLVNGSKFANISDVLLKMRTGNELYTRRGFEYFKFEYQVLKFQKKIGFITAPEFIRFTLLRASFRMMPIIIKKKLYEITRNGK